MCAGTTAVALAAGHSGGGSASSPACQQLPTGPLASSHPRSKPAHQRTLRLPRKVLHQVDRVLAATPTSSPTPPPVQLCVSLQAVTATAQPGQAAAYRIRVWPDGGAVDGISVQASVATGRPAPPFHPPAFSYCGTGDGTATCAVGTLQATQASELQAQVNVPPAAPAGDSVTLTTTVTGTAANGPRPGQVIATATVHIVAAPPTSPRPTPSHHHSSSRGHGKHHGSGSTEGIGSGLQPGNLPSLSSPGGSTTATNPSIEFPAINPGPSTPPATPSHRARPAHTPYRATEAANIVPLNSGQLSTQVAGLIVLVLGIALVLVRVSVRRPVPPREGR